MNETQQSISTIIKGLAIYIVMSIISTIIVTIGAITTGVAVVASVAAGNNDAAAGALIGGLGITGILTVIIALGVIYGLYVYYSGLQRFSSSLDTVGSAAAKNLSYGALLMLIAAVLTGIGVFIPIIGSIIVMLCSIAAFVLNIIGYSSLQKSSTLNALGVEGAKQLFTGFIFAIIATVVVFIPILGWIAAPVLNILYWVYLFKGWSKIRTSFAS